MVRPAVARVTVPLVLTSRQGMGGRVAPPRAGELSSSRTGVGMQWSNDVVVVSWNSNAFFTHDTASYNRNVKLVERWIKRHQFIILPEAHVTEVRLLNFLQRHRQFLGWQTPYGDPEKDHAAGGLLNLACRKFVEDNFHPPVCQVIQQGRGLALTFISEDVQVACLQIVGV